ncbi:MAG: hypothetical protein Q9170_007032 [Blastenia crenularia]
MSTATDASYSQPQQRRESQCMIESGLALIAACLPNINYWIRNLSSKAFARRIQGTTSSFSTHTLQLKYPLEARRTKIDEVQNEPDFLESDLGDIGRLGGVQTHAMGDVEAQGDVEKQGRPPTGVIVVRSDVSCEAAPISPPPKAFSRRGIEGLR